MDPELVCPCGLTCCDCLFYKNEIYEAAQKLKELIQRNGLDTFLNLVVKNKGWVGIAKHLGQSEGKISGYFEPFAKMDNFMKALDGIIGLQCKAPCRRSGGCSLGGEVHECEILRCLQSRKYRGCWDCAEAGNCEKLSFLRKNYGETIDGNLRIARDEGVEAVPSRGDQYYAWQRRMKRAGGAPE